MTSTERPAAAFAPRPEGPAGRSWAGTQVYSAGEFLHPVTVDEVSEIVRTRTRVRALGTRHSFNDVADTSGTLVTLDRLEGEITIADDGQAWVPAGMPYGEVVQRLEAAGRALHNLGSLPHISVAGACLIGTHGSGIHNGNLSTAVRALEYVDARGEVRVIDATDPLWDASVISFGAWGVVTRVALATEPTYRMRQDLFTGLPWQTLLDRFDDVAGAGYSVSVFCRWGADTASSVWVKSRLDDVRIDPDAGLWGAASAATDQLAAPFDDPTTRTRADGVAGRWFERLPHFRYDGTPSFGDEIQSEYFVARADAAGALAAVRGIAAAIDPVLIITELRTVAADTLWMSPSFERDTLAIHFTWRNDPAGVRAVLPLIEEALAPFSARPHWGKWFTMTVDEIRPLYPRFDDFVALSDERDPDQRFWNPYLTRVLGLQAPQR